MNSKTLIENSSPPCAPIIQRPISFARLFGIAPPVGNLIQAVVNQEKQAGDNKVDLIVLNYPSAHLTGCYQHFDPEGQRQVGDELAQTIRKVMDWNYGKDIK